MAETTRQQYQRLQKLEDELLTGLQAAEVKGVSPKAIYEAIGRGALKAAKIGNLYLIHRRDLDAWVIIGHNPPKKRRPRPWAKDGTAVAVAEARDS